MKLCKSCQINKLETEYYKYKYSKDKLRYSCKDCCKDIQAKRQKLNWDQHKSYMYKWTAKNILHKISSAIRTRTKAAIKRKKWYKNSHFKEYIGCTLEELKNHMESQFQSGMTWNNHGKWHIDHIYPLSLAKNEEELYKLCHYTNLQPLWARDNLKKSDNYLG